MGEWIKTLRRPEKKVNVYIKWNSIQPHTKKKGILLFAPTWMKKEDIVPNELVSQRQTELPDLTSV